MHKIWELYRDHEDQMYIQSLLGSHFKHNPVSCKSLQTLMQHLSLQTVATFIQRMPMLHPSLIALTVLFWILTLIRGLSGRYWFTSLIVYHVALIVNIAMERMLKNGPNFTPEGDLCTFIVESMDKKDFDLVEGSRRRFCFSCMGIGHTENCVCSDTYHYDSFSLSVPVSGWRVRLYYWWLFSVVLMLGLTLEGTTIFLAPVFMYCLFHLGLLTSAIMHGMTVDQMLALGRINVENDPYQRLPEQAFEIREKTKRVNVREDGEEKEVTETQYRRYHKDFTIYDSLHNLYK